MKGRVTQVSIDIWRYELDNRFVDVYIEPVLFGSLLFDSQQRLQWRPATDQPYSHEDWLTFQENPVGPTLTSDERKQLADALTEHLSKGWFKTRLKVIPVEKQS